ncbi:MAG: helix-turn-helix domain-containing protein [Thermoanaerobaculia bacterium]
MVKKSTGELTVGKYIRENVIPAGMSVKEAARRLGVGRPALSNLINGNAALSPDMTFRLEKSFGANRQKLLGMQTEADRVKQREAERTVAVRRYVPNFLSIKACQIEAWAEDHLDARSLLPVLLRRLVHSTGHELRRVEFAGYDNAERKGPDGTIEADAATAWIPEGKSRWEFGVTKKPQAKANKDYAARLSLSAAERAESTYVFVTPRNWPNKQAWLKEKTALNDWKAIRVFDASDLEQWLEESIPAQIWLAERLGMPITGCETLDRCWERWTAGSEPRMTPEIFAPSIAAHANTFKEWLAKDSKKPFTIAADSRDEGLAFLACMSEQIEVDSKFRNLAAVFDSPKTLRTLAPSSSPFIPIVATDEAERELVTVYRDHPSIVIRPRNAVDSEPDIALDLLRYDDFENALVAMKITKDEIERLRRESGMSPTILRRRLSQVDAIRSPTWAKDPGTARALIPLMWVGAWNAKAKADTEILSELANCPYHQIEEDIASLLLFDDPPVWSAGNYRGVASKIDLLFAVAKAVTEKEIGEFFTLAEYVLSEADPALELPEDERWAAGIYGKVRDHSLALREGICESLVILSVHGNNLFKDRLGIDIEARVERLIERLLAPLTLDKLMSQQRDLPRYAEAAPEAFLRLLETDLKTTEPVVLGLLKPASSGIFGGCPRAGLLWALECLAWKPQSLPRVVSILAKLAQTKINDTWANKPIGSLQAIFRSWMPQTAASLEERCKALAFLVTRHPDIGWKICLEQFNSGSRIGGYSYRPHWRSDASGAGQPVETQRESSEFVRKALDLALSRSSHDQDTLGDLVGRLDGMAENDQSSLWTVIEVWAANPTTSDTARADLRERIRRFALTNVGRRRIEDETVRDRARAIYAKFEASDPVIRHGWLFENPWIEETATGPEEDNHDFDARDERIHALRIGAIGEVWAHQGFDGLISLLLKSGAASVVGKYAALCVSDLHERIEFLLRCLAIRGDFEQRADDCVLGFLWTVDAAVRPQLLLQVAEKVRPEEQARLFKASPFEKLTWLIAEEFGAEISGRYWNEVNPQWARRQPDSDLNEMVDRLLNVQRPRAAFHAAHMDYERLETSRLKRLLTDVATIGTEASGAYRLDGHDLSEALDALDGRSGVSIDEMAQIEFRFASALEGSKHGIPNIERQIGESPLLYMQIMALIWKRKDDGQDPPEWRIEDAETRRAIDSSMHHVLEQLKRIPGTDLEGKIAASALSDWLMQVRALAAQYARSEITDQCLGQLLAKAPADNSGLWPCSSVCEAMEQIASHEIAKGFQIGVHNQRGAVFHGEGGSQERDLAAKYRGWSQMRAFEYPYVASALEEIARSYEREGEWHDSEARVSKRLMH